MIDDDDCIDDDCIDDDCIDDDCGLIEYTVSID